MAGPKSRVQEIESAFTEPVSVEGARDDRGGARATSASTIPMLRIQGSRAREVTAHVREVHETRTFGGLPIEVRNGVGQRASPPRRSVVLSGPASVLAQVKPEDVRAYVDAAAARPAASPRSRSSWHPATRG